MYFVLQSLGQLIYFLLRGGERTDSSCRYNITNLHALGSSKTALGRQDKTDRNLLVNPGLEQTNKQTNKYPHLTCALLSKVKVSSCTFSGEEEKELIHLADTTSANLSQIQGRELHNVRVQKTLISIYTNALARGIAKACCHRKVICFALLDEKELHKINVRATKYNQCAQSFFSASS